MRRYVFVIKFCRPIYRCAHPNLIFKQIFCMTLGYLLIDEFLCIRQPEMVRKINYLCFFAIVEPCDLKAGSRERV